MSTPIDLKNTFFENNKIFTEIKASNFKSIGDFQDIKANDDVWLLQCPKGFKIKSLENKKFKFPGRIKIDNYEAVAMESTNFKQATFGYAKKKHDYLMKTLPVKGKIVIREQIAGCDEITPEMMTNSNHPKCPLMPESIKLRHPLLGADFDKFLRIEKDIAERLENIERYETPSIKKVKMDISPKKRKNASMNSDETENKPKIAKLKKKSLDSNLLDISDDLQWIKKI